MNKIKRKKFNVSILGESRVGKTCIVSIHNGNHFDPNNLMTVGLDDYIETINLEGQEFKVKIYDTAGQERYRSISLSTVQISDGFILVFSVADRRSFEQINYWLKSIEEAVDRSKKVIILIGNKIDIEERQVTKDEALLFAQKNEFKYYETSAKLETGINEAFSELYQDLYKKYKELENKSQKSDDGRKNSVEINTIELRASISKEKKKNKCC
jgi:small GTP-binding protein